MILATLFLTSQHPLMTDVVYPLGRAPRAPSDSPPTPPLPPRHHLPPPAPPVLLLKPIRAKCLWEACPQILTKVSLIPPTPSPIYYLGSLWYYQVTSSMENKVMFHSLTSHVFLFHADEIKEHFVRFGPLTVDWPHKAQSKAYFPPKGISQAITCCKVFLYFCS